MGGEKRRILHGENSAHGGMNLGPFLHGGRERPMSLYVKQFRQREDFSHEI
ncbi:MAG TPA: hypothetical protein VNE82_01330 [Candidatus Binataceae bacterium]|nr:hypothetical protein [Candidatus Binataceae bacterium]